MLLRKKRMPASGIAVLLFFQAFQAQAQNPPPGPVLPPLFQYNPRAVSEVPLYQERKLEMTMTTDRTVYFTGEQLEVTVTIRNPTREKLTVDEPFVYGTGVILAQRRPLGSTSDGDWQMESPHPIEYRAPDPPKIAIAPGQRIQETLRIPEDCPSARYFSPPCGVRSQEGEYRYLRLSYRRLGGVPGGSAKSGDGRRAETEHEASLRLLGKAWGQERSFRQSDLP